MITPNIRVLMISFPEKKTEMNKECKSFVNKKDLKSGRKLFTVERREGGSIE